MKAIVVKFHGPTNRRGQRLSAKGANWGERRFYAYDYALGTEENQLSVATQYMYDMGWGHLVDKTELVGGELGPCETVYVLKPKYMYVLNPKGE